MRTSLLLMVCLGAVFCVADSHRRSKSYSGKLTRMWCREPLANGVRVPRRDCLLDLSTWRQKIEDKTMYQMYYGSDNDDFDSVLHNPQFNYSIDAANKMKPTFSALDNGTCVDESLFGSPEYDVFGNRDKAEFRQENQYYAFWSSDPDHYHWNLLCFDFDFQSGRCPLDSMTVSLFVNDFPPHNLPIQDVARDLYLGTCLTMDVAPAKFPFFFTYGANGC